MKSKVLLAKCTVQGAQGVILEQDLFVDCKYAPKIFSVPYGVVGLLDGCLSGQESLEEVYLPETLRHIGHGVFANCKNLKIICLPRNLIRFEEIVRVNTNAVVKYVSGIRDRQSETSNTGARYGR